MDKVAGGPLIAGEAKAYVTAQLIRHVGAE